MERTQEAEWNDSKEHADPHRKSDILIVAGLVVTGSFVFAPLGIPILIYGLVLLRRLRQSGEAVRPWVATAVGLFCLTDAAQNYFGWGTDFFWSHDTTLIRTFWMGYGHWFDGGYYLWYNTRGMGGTAFSGEKAMEFMGILLVFPMRIAACWAFLRMKRWGLQYMIMTSWFYILLWVTWVSNALMDYPIRFGAASLGFTGNFVMDIFYFGPFIMLPYLYTVDREQWCN